MPNGNAARDIEERARLRSSHAAALFDGDTITAGVTHEISVGRDKAWVKYEASTKVQDGETASDAKTRVIGHVKASVMEAIEATVQEIRSNR